jgi:predicted transposase YbfD/YdcC
MRAWVVAATVTAALAGGAHFASAQDRPAHAIGCQRDIAQKVLDKNADYILALKGNQGTLREDVELFAAEQKANGFSDTKITRHKTVDGDHGRIETRTYTVIHDVA